MSDIFGRRGAWDLVDGNWVLLDVKDDVLRSGMRCRVGPGGSFGGCGGHCE